MLAGGHYWVLQLPPMPGAALQTYIWDTYIYRVERFRKDTVQEGSVARGLERILNEEPIRNDVLTMEAII
jgi:hypothetical protein